MITNKAEYIANIILHVVLISVFIGVFFFTYATFIEERIVVSQVNYLIDDFADEIEVLPKTYKTVLNTVISNIDKPDMSVQDAQVKENNKALLNKVIIILSVSLVIGISSVYYLSRNYDFSFKELLYKNLIGLVFVGLTEFVFLTFIATSFRSADPNYVKRKILETLRDL